jgi:hypothetical protein
MACRACDYQPRDEISVGHPPKPSTSPAGGRLYFVTADQRHDTDLAVIAPFEGITRLAERTPTET